MNNPIPLPQAATALAELVAVLYQDETDPVSRVLTSMEQYYRPYFSLDSFANIRMQYLMRLPASAEVLSAATAFFGGTVRITDRQHDEETHQLHTDWLGVPLVVSVKVPREDELAALRKQVAELQAAAAPAVSE
jgi:hypothetical protein